jgi:hypothetical protein
VLGARVRVLACPLAQHPYLDIPDRGSHALLLVEPDLLLTEAAVRVNANVNVNELRFGFSNTTE